MLVEKFVRKSDGLEIKNEDIYLELFNSKQEVWLIALELGEDYSKKCLYNCKYIVDLSFIFVPL